MLQQAKRKVQSAVVLSPLLISLKAWPCKTESVELIVCNLVLEHVRDLSVIFEAHRTLVAGGQFFIRELHPFRQYQGTKANFQRGRRRLRFKRSCIISLISQKRSRHGSSVQSLRSGA